MRSFSLFFLHKWVYFHQNDAGAVAVGYGNGKYSVFAWTECNTGNSYQGHLSSKQYIISSNMQLKSMSKVSCVVFNFSRFRERCASRSWGFKKVARVGQESC